MFPETGVYVTEAVQAQGGPMDGLTLPVAALAVNKERNRVIYTRMIFPPQVTVELAAAGVPMDKLMFDFNLN